MIVASVIGGGDHEAAGPPVQSPSPLSETCQRRLNSYALAATAAGVGAIALSRPAEAKIVYTPSHLVMSTSNPQHWWLLDLNHDGVSDFSFSAYTGWA